MAETSISRRAVMRGGLVAAAAGVSGAASAAPTPSVTEGPFYPIAPQTDKDLDLTRVEGASGRAAGKMVWVEGKVVDEAGAPLADAVVDIWQANAAGRYAHERDPNTAPLDPNFQGWAIVATDAEGRYRFKTIVPGAYPATASWTRPPHIHFKVGRRGYREVTTQMFFPGEALNDVDWLLKEIPEAERASVIARAETVEGDPDTDVLLRFDVTLAKV